ncbi:hypothetical protein N7456_012773 [Penicillium angulare]|uniref:RING-type domain-containing protein n=1 Tax=Penicillium angulare TaxID=116970 RepID=A0A9W9EK68_9EURO|nr:hypothetical protein N7456_012773 [Penicillium angulare]
MDSIQSQTDVYHAVLDGIIQRRRTERLQLGRSSRQATEDALVHLSSFGPVAFKQGVEVFRARRLIHEWEDVYHGGPSQIGIGKARNGPGRVIEMTPEATMHISSYRSEKPLSTNSLQNSPEDFARAIIDSLPRRTLGELINQGETAYCVMCMKALGRDTLLFILPCGHWFDMQCLMTWLVKPGKDCCPLCRQAIGVSVEDIASVGDDLVYKSQEYVDESRIAGDSSVY